MPASALASGCGGFLPVAIPSHLFRRPCRGGKNRGFQNSLKLFVQECLLRGLALCGFKLMLLNALNTSHTDQLHFQLSCVGLVRFCWKLDQLHSPACILGATWQWHWGADNCWRWAARGGSLMPGTLAWEKLSLNAPGLNSCLCSEVSFFSHVCSAARICGSWGRCYLVFLEHESSEWGEERAQPLRTSGRKEGALPPPPPQAGSLQAALPTLTKPPRSLQGQGSEALSLATHVKYKKERVSKKPELSH